MILFSYFFQDKELINLNTTVGMFLGRWKNQTPKFKQIKWSKDPVKALGVIHGHNVNIDALCLEKNKKIKSCLEVWKTRDLAYQGKVLILKTCIISQIHFEIEILCVICKHITFRFVFLIGWVW
jgi:hypothetical protein